MLTPESRTLEILRGKYDPSTDTGYMGYVPASEFITGEQLIDQLDFHDGIDLNSDCGWLKFYVGPTASCNTTDQQKILYIAKQPLKHSVSWDVINNARLVYGDTRITINGQLYTVRLMTGGDYFPGYDSEWNELLYRVYLEQPDGKSNWETFDLQPGSIITGGNGRYVWCQETPLPRPNERIIRGYYSLVYWTTYTSSSSYSNRGWRPVLELIL